MSLEEPDRVSDHDKFLSEPIVVAIQRKWDTRVTIASLAEEFGITERMVRTIIALPRR